MARPFIRLVALGAVAALETGARLPREPGPVRQSDAWHLWLDAQPTTPGASR
ncbi:hypothetical protein [Archangium sp.]|uniref:hypothetical protein n=1 Tax=Archangium sp. TaxID=1872627 RepID=UPI002D4EBBAA|nr:hypothetical protein [Archangium sp.]HYO59531.1 hypothetical protein [Archangium sp.]